MTPMPVIIVFAGNKIGDDIKAALIKSGIAVELNYKAKEEIRYDKNGNKKKKVVSIEIEDDGQNLKQLILYMLGYNIFNYIQPKHKIK